MRCGGKGFLDLLLLTNLKKHKYFSDYIIYCGRKETEVQT